MAAVQLNFSLRTSSNVKTVHLLGSWDNYNGQLPLSKDSSKKGGWKGTFRFQSSMIEQGQRYWYYYIVDGYHVSHDPSQSSTKEPTTGRTLNILDVPAGKSSSSSASSRRSRDSAQVAKGRPLSTSQIKSPKPQRPGQTRHLYDRDTIEELTSRFETTGIQEDEYYSSSPSSVGSSLSSRSGSSSPTSDSSLSDYSSPASSVCSCERYGITRRGDRVKLDCGGSRCGYSDSECSSDSDSEVSRKVPQHSTRRHGMYVRR